MHNDALIPKIVERIRGVTDPERIVLFGSRSRGDAGAHSDYDVLVVQESPLPRYKRSGALYAALSDLPAEVDVLVYTPAEIAEWSAVPMAFVTTALREGKSIYERPR
jgi:predicted nucleotidyltransferase